MTIAALTRAAFAAAALAVVLPPGARADSSTSDTEAVRPVEPKAEQPASDTSAAVVKPASAVARAALMAKQVEPRIDRLPAAAIAPSGGVIVTQTEGVRTGRFPEALQKALRQISQHFGKPVVVTSGLRGGGRRGSFHRACKAADIQIAGVSPGAIARYARTIETVGGVGTYRHTRSVHVDVGDRVFSWHGSRGRNASLGASGCCPVCAATATSQPGQDGRPRLEAVCTG